MDSDTELELSLPEMSGNGSDVEDDGSDVEDDGIDVEDDGIEVEPAPEGVAKPSIDGELKRGISLSVLILYYLL
jgi:hypothetical protein